MSTALFTYTLPVKTPQIADVMPGRHDRVLDARGGNDFALAERRVR